MSTFGDAIALWCSLASRVLGWRPGEFWQATPTELAAALREPEALASGAPPSADVIAQMMERDNG
ncbi:phage tail assembly chaperone [Qipengyuania nanhaisediminis]|uniref:phage tail assembly chaperone n=1 Tax=Qipengyuania nanhaisediminis TaxID=604088 RepID=UPI0038B2DD06